MPPWFIHRTINFFVWIASLLVVYNFYYIIKPFLYYGSLFEQLPGWGLADPLPILIIWIGLYSFSMYIFTVKINPDWDINTCLKYILNHRGIWSLHNPLAWLMLFIPLLSITTSFLGGLIAILSHITADYFVYLRNKI